MEVEVRFQRVYRELRELARSKLAGRKHGQTLQPTALVHEAFVRMHGAESWTGEDHFFCAAAEAMRHILVDQARRKGALKGHGGAERIGADPEDLEGLLCVAPETVLSVNEALENLEAHDAGLAQLVKLRFFSGLTLDEVVAVVGTPKRTLQRQWRLAAARLRADLGDETLAEMLRDARPS